MMANLRGRVFCKTGFRIFMLCMLLTWGNAVRSQVSSNVTVTPITTPTSLTPCSGQGTFVVRVTNISASAISNLVFRDSMPAGINYVAGSVSGTGVSFGSTVTASNVVTFNIANIPSSGFVDISFNVATNCSVVGANVSNNYKVTWGSFFTNVFTTPTYPVAFPSISVTVLTNATITANCYVPFVRQIQICNGGAGALDSVTLTDAQSNTSVITLGFNRGTVTGAGTNNARTVLKAADFTTVGNGDGKLDQNECIIVNDTLQVTGSATPITSTIRANYGCYGSTCTSATTNNVQSATTNINPASPPPTLSRTQTTIGTDSSGNIYGRPITYREVVKNTGTTIAKGVRIFAALVGLKYIVTDSIWASRNGGPRYHPFFTVNTSVFFGNVNSSLGNVIAPTTYTGSNLPGNSEIYLDDILPGDSVVVTFVVRTAGPITRVSDASTNFCSVSSFEGNCYIRQDGPSISAPVDARLLWFGCPTTTWYQNSFQQFPQNIYTGNGSTPVSELIASANPHYLARFRNFSFTDSTALSNPNSSECGTVTYGANDTIKMNLRADVMDLPFYTAKSKFAIKIYTQGGIKWDGNLSKVYGSLTTWNTAKWQAASVVDNSAIDSTITINFSRATCPASVLSSFSSSTYNSYEGKFSLNIQLVNTCTQAFEKRLWMTRIYTIDTTNTEPAIESGPTAFNTTWNSKCSNPCSNGVSIIDFSHTRTTFGSPDNNNDGVADASGSLNMSIIKNHRITLGDTLQFTYKMVVHTTQPGGMPYFYLNSAFTDQGTNNIVVNTLMKKLRPEVKLTRGATVYNAVGSSDPVVTNENYLLNLSLQGTGGISIPAVTSYMEGDTVEVTQSIVYWTYHTGWQNLRFNMFHTPYTSSVPNPAAAQRNLCDSITCSIVEVQDMNFRQLSSVVAGPGDCGRDLTLRAGFVAAPSGAACGNIYFPGEARNIATPGKFKIVINGGWTFQNSINGYWHNKLNGTSNCTLAINNQPLPASLYSMSGDTLIVDLVAMAAHFGQNININQLQSYFYFDIKVRYNTPSSPTCSFDHTAAYKEFSMAADYITNYPTDKTGIAPLLANTLGVAVGPNLNNNNVGLPTINTVTVTQPLISIPLRYNNADARANDFLAIPPIAGVVVDSVKDNVTGAIIPAVGNIYNLSYLPVGNRDFTVFTRVTDCVAENLVFYADRMPCNGIPASWAAYDCKSNANSITFQYITRQGELQMQSNFYTTQKDLCVADTVEFVITNSQTQTAKNVTAKFELPANMTLLPGQTQLKKGSGAYITVSDPVLNAGVYSWTLPATDSLTNIGTAPENVMKLRCAVITSCGFVSGSQVTTSVAGNVGCGPITSLLSTNTLPLNINGAPSLSYFTNVKATVNQVDNCTSGATFDYKVVMKISGGSTGSNDSIRVVLPAAYSFVSYSAVIAGSHNAPPAQPVVTTLANGSHQLCWVTPAGVAGGDSVVYTFKYKELDGSNKCGVSPARSSWVNTFINSTAFCVTTGSNCLVSISNGADTIALRSLKPALSTSVSNSTFHDACDANGQHCGLWSTLDINGTIANNGSAAVLPGTPVYMEVFMDLDNSGTINAGDKPFKTLVYTGGLAVGASYTYTYRDSVLRTECPTCANKKILLRFSNTPATPVSASQCLCDSLTVTPVTPLVLLDVKLGSFDAELQDCNTAKLAWNTLLESGSNTSFEVQESLNGTQFNTVAVVRGRGISTGSSYTQLVNLKQNIMYYRLLMKDNGGAKYSNIIPVRSNCYVKPSIQVYPNPAKDQFAVSGALAGSQLSLFDASGRLVKQQTVTSSANTVMNIATLPAEVYFLKAANADGSFSTIKIRKQ